MPDVIVHRCTLRMVRTGGWSWGRSPDDLVDAALDALPGLVEAACAGLDEDYQELSGPMRVSASVSLSELQRRGADALRDALTGGLDAASPVRAAADDDRASVRSRRSTPGASDRRAAPEGSSPAPSPRDLLLRWLRDGVLDELLELLAPESLEAWHTAALGRATPVHGEAARVDPDTRRMVESLLDALPEAETREHLLRARLALAAAAAAPRSDWPAAVALADAARPAPAFAEPPAGASVDRREAAGRHRTGRREGAPDAWTPGSPAGDAIADGTKLTGVGDAPLAPASSVALALPFLVAVPLARIGYFDVLTAGLAAARLGDRTPHFAAAFAYKLLDPPERGWRRAPEAERAAAAFAGAEFPAEALTELAREAPLFASALDAQVAVAVMAGRGREAVLLHRDASGQLVLLDPVGSFPIALSPDPDAIARVILEGGRPAVHVTPTARSSEVLGALSRARIPVDARRRSRRSPADLERLDSVLSALSLRSAAPLAEDHTLERTLSLAAGLGLAMLAWALWGGSGRTDALLALDRLGDIEGRVRVEPERVRVTLPMGRRHRDLWDASMLAGVGGLPWLGGRRLEFGA